MALNELIKAMDIGKAGAKLRQAECADMIRVLESEDSNKLNCDLQIKNHEIERAMAYGAELFAGYLTDESPGKEVVEEWIRTGRNRFIEVQRNLACYAVFAPPAEVEKE